jgi:site-specific DNA-methyltransferase (adenine-specific)
MSRARYIVGDTRAVVATIPDGTVDLVLTSPPFLALRSYLPADHPDKGLEIGSEATPAQYLDVLLELTAEWGRVLAPHGSICVELGDTYSGHQDGGDAGGMTRGARLAAERHLRPARATAGWPLPKCLTLVPELYRIALAYGINPLTGAPSPAGRWRVRNVVRWVRPNPPVGALGDKYRPATSDLVIACRHGKRYFDLDAVRTDHTEPDADRQKGGRKSPLGGDWNGGGASGQNRGGAPPLDWWCIPPGGYTGSHYAVFPPELLHRPIKTMVPPRVCTTCGRPSERIVETEHLDDHGGAASRGGVVGKGVRLPNRLAVHSDTLGWSDCGHDTWRPGHVLDPFAGTGTTGLVATGHGHNATLIDLDGRNADLALERLGMFLDVEHHTPEEAA